MAKRKTSAEAPSKSDSVRGYLAEHPEAGIKAIVAGLAQQGITVSEAIASKIKYDKGRPKKRRKAARAAARHAVAGNGAELSKSDEIRNTFKEMGRRTRPRDIIAALAERGIRVSASEVVRVRSDLRKKAAKARHLAAASSETSPAAASSPARATSANGLSADDLIAAKRLADQLGGLERMKAVLAVLDQLK